MSVQNRAQQVFDEVSRAANYEKFVRKSENISQKQSSDLVKGKDNQNLSSNVEKPLHQPVNLQKSAIESSYMQFCDVAESQLCDAAESQLCDVAVSQLCDVAELQSVAFNEPCSNSGSN